MGHTRNLNILYTSASLILSLVTRSPATRHWEWTRWARCVSGLMCLFIFAAFFTTFFTETCQGDGREFINDNVFDIHYTGLKTLAGAKDNVCWYLTSHSTLQGNIVQWHTSRLKPPYTSICNVPYYSHLDLSWVMLMEMVRKCSDCVTAYKLDARRK